MQFLCRNQGYQSSMKFTTEHSRAEVGFLDSKEGERLFACLFTFFACFYTYFENQSEYLKFPRDCVMVLWRSGVILWLWSQNSQAEWARASWQGVADSIRSALFLRSKRLALKTATSPSRSPWGFSTILRQKDLWKSNNKRICCNTMARAALIHISIQND